MKLALAMIVKGTEEEAEVLARCLRYTAPHVDGIFITCTHKKGEKVSQKLYDVCNLYKATTTTFEWINDFAAARNFSFSQVPKEYDYNFWLDADDVPRGMEKLKDTIDKHPQDIYTMQYLYAFDERKNPTVVHQKTRVVKNDGCVEWYGMGLHEDFKDNRVLSRYAIKGIEILHLSTEDRYADSRERNYQIASEWVSKFAQDPRVYWNLGNSAFGVGKFEEAMKAFDSFLELSLSDDEKYIVRQRRADVYQAQGNLQKALEEAQYAIGAKPAFPDAYHLAGRLYYEMGKYELAKDMFLNGLGRPAPVYEIIVYNPRDYDYTPLLNLAKTYYALNLPQLALPALEAAVTIVPADEALKKTIKILKKESKEGEELVLLVSKMRKMKDIPLKKALDSVPSKFKYHPAVCQLRNTRFPKTTSTGRDLVIFCGHTEEEWTPELIKQKGSGGSEEAAITLAQGLADKGWNVTVYNNCGNEESKHGSVIYRPYMSWNFRDKQDVVILWRQTKPLDWEINATHVYMDLHDVIQPAEFTPARLQKITKVFLKSKFHRSLFPNFPDDKIVIIPNGIHPEDFPAKEKDPFLMIHTASPLRGISSLIDIIKVVLKEVPEAKLQWAYGWTVTDQGMKGEAKYPDWKASILQGCKDAGIEDLGRLNHKQVADLYLKASLYLYPTGFPEIDCMSITKALAAGAAPITTDYGAIGEKEGHGGEFLHYEEEQFPWLDMAIKNPKLITQFVKAIVKHLKHPTSTDREWALKTYSWDSIIKRWNDEITVDTKPMQA